VICIKDVCDFIDAEQSKKTRVRMVGAGSYVNLSDYKISKNWPEGGSIQAGNAMRQAIRGAWRRSTRSSRA
jgi:hypothetical protein